VPDEFWTNVPWEVVVAGAGEPRRIELKQPFALVGSGDECDVILPDSRLPARCFVALLSDSGLVGASLVRRSIARFLPMNATRGIRVGRFRVQFELTTLAIAGGCDQTCALPTTDFTPEIRWRIGGRKKYAQLIGGKPLLFGRRKPSRLQIDDSAVSSIHGVIYQHAEHLWLIDLHSTNGTRINGHRVRCASLLPGQSFTVGGTRLKYVAIPKPASQSTQPAVTQSMQQQAAELAQLANQYAESQSEIAKLDQQHRQLEQLLTERMFQSDWLCQLAIELVTWRQQLEKRQEELDGQEHDAMQRLDQQYQQLNEERLRYQSMAEQAMQQLASDRASLEAERDHWIDQRERERVEQDQQLEQVRAQLEADGLRQHEEHTRLLDQLHQAKELLLVRRIRLQRECERREQELAERQQRLDQQEQAMRQRAESEPRRWRTGKRSRKVPLPPGVADANPLRQPSPADGPATAEVPFELANSLLESADFTHILKDFINNANGGRDSA
jgi:pSer/pThr/pTyr-binding forkhead associated (FHA) protein